MKTKKLGPNKFQLEKNGVFAIITMRKRGRKWFFRLPHMNLAATGAEDQKHALQVAGEKIFDQPGRRGKNSSTTFGQLLNRLFEAQRAGLVEGRRGAPIGTSYVNSIRHAVKRVMGEAFEDVKVSSFADKIHGIPRPFAEYQAQAFRGEDGETLTSGAEYYRRVGTYNHTVTHFKALFQNDWINNLFEGLKIDPEVIEAVKNLKKKKGKDRKFEAMPEELVSHLDHFFADKANLMGEEDNQHNLFLRYWLARCCGLRRGEVINARHNWIEQLPKGGFLLNIRHTDSYGDEFTALPNWSPKSKAERSMGIPVWLAEYIQRNRRTARPDEPLNHRNGYGKSLRNYDDLWSKCWSKALKSGGYDPEEYRNKYPRTTHQLRGEYCTEIANERGLQIAATVAGHSSAETTERYYFDRRKADSSFVFDPRTAEVVG